jgi:hypothetical protein
MNIGFVSAAEVRVPRLVRPAAGVPLAGSVTGFVVAPPTMTLTSNDPDAGAGGTATVNWDLSGGKPNRDWELAVRADSASFTNCPGVPMNAVRLSCLSVVRQGTGNPRGSCVASGTALTTADQVVAAGNRGGGGSTFTVTVSLAFTDSWRFAASQSCSVSLTYSLNYDVTSALY